MVKLIDVKKNYEGFALNCSMEIKSGTITGLIGKNGAGKSTIFKAMLGLIEVDGGEVKTLGKNASKLKSKDKQEIGVAFADSGFSNYLTVKQICKILNPMYEKFDAAEFMKECARFDIPTSKKIKEFSTGMKAKLKVLVALSHHAKLLILDEPTVGLDVVAREQILQMIREYMEKNEEAAVVISSHISSDIETLCDEIYLIVEGKIALHEDTDVLLSDYGLLKVSEEVYKTLDKQYIIAEKKEGFGYSCLTDQARFYRENYPGIVLESGKIDDLILLMNGGK